MCKKKNKSQHKINNKSIRFKNWGKEYKKTQLLLNGPSRRGRDRKWKYSYYSKKVDIWFWKKTVSVCWLRKKENQRCDRQHVQPNPDWLIFTLILIIMPACMIFINPDQGSVMNNQPSRVVGRNCPGREKRPELWRFISPGALAEWWVFWGNGN